MALPHAGGFRYILVMSDNASSYTWVVLMPHQDAKNIVQCLDNIIFSQHGTYEEINFEGASQLMGTAMKRDISRRFRGAAMTIIAAAHHGAFMVLT